MCPLIVNLVTVYEFIPMQRVINMLSAACFTFAANVSPVQSTQSTMLASWYGPGFHSRTTANGEVYDQMGYTAAHKTLAFGTRLRVCYQGCVNVRINDRGPYIGARELDLSYAAAKAIGLIDPGVAAVQITYI